MDIDTIRTIDARLALHEFLLEQLFANGFLNMPNAVESWRAFGDALLAAQERAWSNDGRALSAEQEELLVEVRARAQHFINKVAVRIKKP